MEKFINVTPFVRELQEHSHDITKKYGECLVSKTLDLVIDQISNLPAVNMVPIKHAHWIHRNGYTHCSNCDEIEDGNWLLNKYCSYCGALLDEEEVDEK